MWEKTRREHKPGLKGGGGVAGTFQSKLHCNRPWRPLGLLRVGVRSGSVLK